MSELVGSTFTRWTVVAFDSMRGHHPYWLCRCECGTERPVCQGSLTGGKSTSCGCLGLENRTRASRTHGKTKTPEYRSWCKIKRRCLVPEDPHYPYYGGRGIRMCARWRSFEAFYEDMGPRPSPSHSVNRIDNDGDYEPNNCEWATMEEQSRNRRSNVNLTFRGKTQCASAWAEEVELSASQIIKRVKVLGWSDERALAEPSRKLKVRSRSPRLRQREFAFTRRSG